MLEIALISLQMYIIAWLCLLSEQSRIASHCNPSTIIKHSLFRTNQRFIQFMNNTMFIKEEGSEGRTTSSSPETTTKNGAALCPCSQSTSPSSIVRMCPCAAVLLSCAGVNFGNICSIRELVRGSPLRVLDIVVIYSVVAPDKSSLESLRLSLSEKEYPNVMHILRDSCKKIGGHSHYLLC